MEVIHIDLRLFYSSTGTFGYFCGEIEVSRLPRADEPLAAVLTKSRCLPLQQHDLRGVLAWGLGPFQHRDEAAQFKAFSASAATLLASMPSAHSWP